MKTIIWNNCVRFFTSLSVFPLPTAHCPDDIDTSSDRRSTQGTRDQFYCRLRTDIFEGVGLTFSVA